MSHEYGINNEIVLIEALKKGERASFDRIVDMYQEKGINIAYNMLGNLEDAKDVLQDAFVKIYTGIKNFRGQSKFSTWFYRIVVNCSLDFLRRRKRANKIFVQGIIDEEGAQPEVPDLHYDPAKIIMDNELSRKLDECIESLPEKQRTCFILKHREGLTSSQIAEILKCRYATVKVHLFRAVRALQDKLAAYIVR